MSRNKRYSRRRSAQMNGDIIQDSTAPVPAQQTSMARAIGRRDTPLLPA